MSRLSRRQRARFERHADQAERQVEQLTRLQQTIQFLIEWWDGQREVDRWENEGGR